MKTEKNIWRQSEREREKYTGKLEQLRGVPVKKSKSAQIEGDSNRGSLTGMSDGVVQILPEFLHSLFSPFALRNLPDITLMSSSFLETRSHFLFSSPRRGYSTISSIHRAFPPILGHRLIRLHCGHDLGRDPILN